MIDLATGLELPVHMEFLILLANKTEVFEIGAGRKQKLRPASLN